MGGAQRVHLDILEAFSEFNKLVIFTRKSSDDTFKNTFYSSKKTFCTNLHFVCEKYIFRLFSVHYFAFVLNKLENGAVISSNSTFFYDLVPFVKNKKILKIELLHNFSYGDNGMEHFGLAIHDFLDFRVVIDKNTKKNILNQYADYGVSSVFFDRVHCIENGVSVNKPSIQKSNGVIKVLYAGRGGKQKRAHLIEKVVNTVKKYNFNRFEFHFAGPVIEELSTETKNNSILHGNISNMDDMNMLYADCHIVLMTSSYEGFPMLIKEAMAYGCVPLVTALEGNKSHLIHGYNSLLIDNFNDEENVVNVAVEYLTMILNQDIDIQKISFNCQQYANQYFGKENFKMNWKSLLEKYSV